jgi:hypothetical protein
LIIWFIFENSCVGGLRFLDWEAQSMLVKSLAIGDTLTAGVSSDNLSKLICGCARTIAAAVELLLLTRADTAIARCLLIAGREGNARKRPSKGRHPAREEIGMTDRRGCR